MLVSGNQIGVPQDLANFITLSDEHDTPMLKRFAKSKQGEIKQVLNEYQGDTYRSVRRSNMPEGKDWSSFPGQNQRGLLKARINRFDATGSVSDLAEDVQQVNGVPSEVARRITQDLVVMGREKESWIGGDQAAFEGNEVIQNRGQSMGLWIQSGTTNQLYETPSNLRPNSAQIYTGTKANFHEDALNSLLQQAWKSTGRKDRLVGFVGPELKKRVSSFSLYVPGSLSTINTAHTSNRNLSDKAIERVIDVFAGDFGSVALELDNYLASSEFDSSGTAPEDWRGYFVHPEMWDVTYHQMPKAEQLEFQGGNYKYGIYCYARLRCLNPIGEVKVAPSDA